MWYNWLYITTQRQSMIKSIIENNRLVYYATNSDSHSWEAHWKNYLKPESYLWAEKGRLGWYEKPFTKYLPKHGRILEAGCGIGNNVLALRVRGYDCEGIECSQQTVAAIMSLRPEIPVRTGDVTHINVPDGFYKGYISLGVIEHCQEGPESFLREAYRVLSDDGMAYISVPYFHCLRRLKGMLGFYYGHTRGMKFYQYAFSIFEMKAILRTCGFQIIEIYCYDTWKGLKDEIVFMRWIRKIPKVGSGFEQVIHKLHFLDRWFGHMVGFVVKKSS